MEEHDVEFAHVEDLEGIETEIGTPVVIHKDGQEQMVIWPSASTQLPNVIFEHEFLAVGPIPTDGWVPAANYDWDSESKKLVKRPEVGADGEG